MSRQDRYSTSLLPWSGMIATTRLTDGSAGDTLTGETADDSATIGDTLTCQIASLSALLVAETRFDTEQALTAWTPTGSLSLTLAQLQSICVPDVDLDYPSVGGLASITLYSWTGSAWSEVDTLSLTIPTLVVGTASESFPGLSRSVSSVTSCRFRTLLAYTYDWVGNRNTITIDGRLSDLRLTTTDTGTPCDGGSGGGGGGSEDGSNCEYAEDPATDCTYADDPSTSCTYVDG